MKRLLEIERCVFCRWRVGDACTNKANITGNVNIGVHTKMIDGFPSWCPLEVIDDAS